MWADLKAVKLQVYQKMELLLEMFWKRFIFNLKQGETIKDRSNPKVTTNATLFLTSHDNYVFFLL